MGTVGAGQARSCSVVLLGSALCQAGGITAWAAPGPGWLLQPQG